MVLRGDLVHVVAAALGEHLVAQHPLERVGQPFDVARRDGQAEAAGVDERGEDVALRADHRQAGPQVVEHPGAEGEGGLDVVEVVADAHVGVEQVVGPVVVADPFLVEEHVGAGQAPLRRKGAGGEGHPHLRHVRVRVLHAQEEQPDVVAAVLEQVHGLDQRERVEPVVDPAAPQDDLVPGADAGHDALERRAGALRRQRADPEGCHVDERAQRDVVVVGHGVEPAERGQVAQPEVPLLLARADHEVAAQALLVGLGNRVADDQAAGLGRVLLGLLELLEVERVVEVDDDDLLAALQERVLVQDVALEEQHVAPRVELAGARLVGDRADLEVEAGDQALRRRDQAHLVVDRQRGGDLPGADRRAGHLRLERVGRGDGDARAHHRGGGLRGRCAGAHEGSWRRGRRTGPP